MTDYKELLIEARNLLVLCTMLDKSDHCQNMVNKIDQALQQPDVSGSLPLAVSSILDKHLPADGKIGGSREMLRMQIHQDMLKILSGNDR